MKLYLNLFSCKCFTDAYKRMVIGKAPPALCLQLMRIGADGKKLLHTVKYDDLLTIKEHNSPDDGTMSISSLTYKLVTLVVHIGSERGSGHYLSYIRRNGKWYCADDTNVNQSSSLDALSQQAYLLFYEKVKPDESVVEISSGFPVPPPFTNCESSERPSSESIHIQYTTPPSYFISQKCSAPQAPRVCKTTKSCDRLVYPPVSEAERAQAEVLVSLGHCIPQHPRTRGWEVGELSYS